MIRVLALLESYSACGPAGNLIEFARSASQPDGDLPAVALSIVTFQRGSREQPPSAFVTAAREAGVPIEVLFERRRLDMQLRPQLRELVNERRPDIIQTHNMKSHLLVRSLGLRHRYPWVAFHHGYTSVSAADRLYRLCDRWSLPGAFRVVVVCKAFGELMQRLGVSPDRIAVQHNAVTVSAPPSVEETAALRSRLGIPDGVPVILAVGRLSREKAHRDLLEALAMLRNRRPGLEFRAVVAGDGPERQALQQACTRLGLDADVILAGHQANIGPYYAMADVLALPSHSEGSPNVVLESMASGLPVAATIVGGVPEIIEDGVTGLLVPPGEPAAMAGAVARLLQEPGLAVRLASAATRRIEEKHSREAYRRSMVRFYRDVAGAYAGTPDCRGRCRCASA